MLAGNVSPQINQAWQLVNRLNAQEKLVLAKLLLDSIVATEAGDEVDWQHLSLAAFEVDWNNAEDAIYDNWKELYDQPSAG
ncbi:MAG: hypothetical protein R6X34_22510 [Chloroflexota bacterium]